MEQPFRPEEPPTWFLRLGHTADEWRRVAEGQQKRLDAEWWQGVLAVYDHFGIEFSAPGAHKDLALSLAFRHERKELLQGQRVCYRALCERYGVDPDEPLAEVTLAYKLMNRFVRREKKQSEPSTNPGTRFATNELILLMVAVARAKEHLVNNGKNVSVRAIARCLRDRDCLAGIFSLAESIQAILSRRGNKAKGIPQPLSDRRLRQIINEIEMLEAPVRDRKLSDLQPQLFIGISELLTRSPVGQNRAQIHNHE
jgi:hypothetical protein